MTDISVIIPAFRPKTFDTLINSISTNADVHAEWIVIDDGSGGEYDAVFSSLPEGIQVIRQSENRRQGAARNIGLSIARGQWIKFLDADDALDSGHLAALLNSACERKALPFAPTKHVFGNRSTKVNDSWRTVQPEPDAQYLRQLVRPFLHHGGALFPRDLLMKLGGYDEDLVTDEDGDLLLRILNDGYHFRPVENVHYLYIHRDDGDRVSADDNICKMRARIRVCDKVESTFSAKITPELAEALAQRMDKIAMTYWASFPKEAQALLCRAQRLSPGYPPDIRRSLRLLRKIGGPRMVFAMQDLYRRLRKRPKGGAQG